MAGGEERAGGERKYDLANYPPDAPLAALAAAIKARWVCEQAHRQLKRELGLGPYEGRGWLGLPHHLVPARIAFVFLQHLRRLRGRKRRRIRGRAAARRRGRACRRCGATCSRGSARCC